MFGKNTKIDKLKRVIDKCILQILDKQDNIDVGIVIKTSPPQTKFVLVVKVILYDILNF